MSASRSRAIRTATVNAGAPKSRVAADAAPIGALSERLSVESPGVTDFAKAMQSGNLSAPSLKSPRLSINPENARNGLAQLVLTLMKLLHELLERQAIRRVDSGSLTTPQIERLGITLMRQGEEIEKLREVLGLKEEDLNIDLGPFGKLV